MFSKKSKDIIEEKNYTKICALLIHAAKIDQNFSLNEENIIFNEGLIKIFNLKKIRNFVLIVLLVCYLNRKLLINNFYSLIANYSKMNQEDPCHLQLKFFFLFSQAENS